MKLIKAIGLAAATAVGLTLAVNAAGTAKHAPEMPWSFQGIFGKYDKAAVQRGFQVYKEVCSACHALDYFRFRNLADVGFSVAQVKAIAAEFEVPGDLDEFGEPTMRTALPQDGYPRTIANDVAAVATFGALPPDLSLLVKARHGGADYIYALLNGYASEDADENNKYANPYFKGGVISMAPPIYDGSVDYKNVSEGEGADGRGVAVDGDAGGQGAIPHFPTSVNESRAQYAHDIVQFLAWVAEPTLEQRKSSGFAVILFLIIMTGLLYLSKKKVWKNVKDGAIVVSKDEYKGH